MSKILKHLSHQSLIHGMSKIVKRFEEHRQESKIKHNIHDVVMSGEAMMYFQQPSLLQFQQYLRVNYNTDNLKTLFKVETIPKDSQMRNVLDEIDPEEFRPIFNNFFHRLQRGKHLDEFQLFDKSYLIAIDGSEYFSSDNIECPNCLFKNHKNGSTTYHHQILQGVLINPNIRQIIPIMPEQICNINKGSKQDCEFNASKRFIKKLRKDHYKLKITIVGDGLSSKQSFISYLREHKMNYILVAKPNDHVKMMEAVELCKLSDEIVSLNIVDEKGHDHFYQYANNIPLNGEDDTIYVNYFYYEVTVLDRNGNKKILYKNNWVTDTVINQQNIVDLVKAGKARWKIENECFNTLKNRGYYIDHNYGHGQKNLSFNFLILTLIAFLIHQIAELTDDLYQKCRMQYKNKRALWEKARAAITWFVFDTWEGLLRFLLNPEDYLPVLKFNSSG